ncbi:hypothetical protein PT277_01555 [Acetobacteraceae bacterium ESL0709]|nr:hypothetical protein [Acetobacteraceae bacterium ESL0697]MDF7677387.1 hypothetical protein [Acetobacteraceae bacterium ESL0709]
MARQGLPGRFTAGTSFHFKSGVGTVLIMRGACALDLRADASGVIHVSAEETATWKAGSIAYSLRRTDADGHVSELASGTMLILPDLASLPEGADTRSQNRRTYEAICAVIENRASRDQMEYKIGNRELKRMAVSDLLKLRSVYGRYVAQENGRSGFAEHRIFF